MQKLVEVRKAKGVRDDGLKLLERALEGVRSELGLQKRNVMPKGDFPSTDEEILASLDRALDDVRHDRLRRVR